MPMNEKLLHYIWKFQLFNKAELLSTNQESLSILRPGIHNHNQGPDFSDARIKYDGKLWSGNVELHVLSSDWLLHKHHEDEHYRNVILHVVWQHDKEVFIGCPTLELKHIVPKILLNKYQLFLESKASIPCQNHLHLIDEIVITKWKERMLAERLQQKANRVIEYLSINNYNWQEACWWLLARNFGNKVNAEAFEQIVKTIPFNIILKHRNSLLQLEALLLGQAGLLKERFTDKYAVDLKTEYIFLKNKYRLKDPRISMMFLRMRPANFPTIRLVQLATFMNHNESFFSRIINAQKPEEVKLMFDIDISPYWKSHYRPDVEAIFKNKKMGNVMINQLIINTIIVILFAYGYYHKIEKYQQLAMLWMEEMKPDVNHICNQLSESGFQIKSAFDSQSLMQLKQNYCDEKLCLQCGIGNAIFKKS